MGDNIFEILERELRAERTSDSDESIYSDDSDDSSEEDHISDNDISDEEIEMNEVHLLHNGADFVSNDGTQWILQPPPAAQARQANILRRQTGLTPLAQQANGSRLEVFQLFLTDPIIDQIVLHTNGEAIRVQNVNPPTVRFTPVDNLEIRAFIAILLYAGVSKSSKENYNDLWHPIHGKPFYKATMRLERFKQILRFIRFDDKRTREERRRTDKAAPFTDLFQMIVARWRLFLIPGNDVTVDEQLVKFRGRYI